MADKRGRQLEGAEAPTPPARERRRRRDARCARRRAGHAGGCPARGALHRRRGTRPRTGSRPPRSADRARSTTTSWRRRGAMAARRAAGEPLQYVFGHWPFRSLDLPGGPAGADPAPRDRTGRRGRARRSPAAAPRACRGPASSWSSTPGPGLGAIALSVAAELGSACRARGLGHRHERRRARGGASEPGAASQAAHDGVLPGVELVDGNWLEPLPARRRGAVALVVSNPPYVSEAEWGGLDDVVRAEPREALVAGPASDGTPGLADVEAVLTQSRDVAGRARRGDRRAGAAPGRGGRGAGRTPRLHGRPGQGRPGAPAAGVARQHLIARRAHTLLGSTGAAAGAAAW